MWPFSNQADASREESLPGYLVCDWTDEAALEEISYQLDLRIPIETKVIEKNGGGVRVPG